MSNNILILGVSGQDGSYLTRHLVELNYNVYGIMRRNHSSTLEDLIIRYPGKIKIFKLDLNNIEEILKLLKEINPIHIYNLSGKTSVADSFLNPQALLHYETNVTGNFLELIKKYFKHIKYFNASSCEIFGNNSEVMDEESDVSPINPYGIAKTSSHLLTNYYRTNFDLFAINGILFNHESPLRSIQFVTKKIIRSAALTHLGIPNELRLGEVSSIRDWGYAPEYVDGMFRSMSLDYADNFVFATGVGHSIAEFAAQTFSLVDANWRESLCVDKTLFRSVEIKSRVGDATKAQHILNWTPKVKLSELIEIMLNYEIQYLSNVSIKN